MGLRRALAGAYLRLTGWTIDGDPPPLTQYVLIGAPHTSNWDFVYLLAYTWRHELRGVSWVGKHTLFRPPFGTLARRLGGIPVDRRSPHDTVRQLADAFARRDPLILTVTPEGTRGYGDYWKSGFYHTALAAGVPLVLGYLDYARRRLGFGPVLHPTGDLRADMDKIRAFYADKTGKYPDHKGRIRLRAEDEIN